MKKLIYLLLVLCFTNVINAQWVQVPSGTFENLTDIQFVDANTGYTVGNAGVVLKTTNGGQNWVTINTGSSSNNLSLYFLNSSTGYIGNKSGSVLFTTNGGGYWATLSYYRNFTSIFFLNTNTGYATSSDLYGGFYTTTNGGNNWSIGPYANCRTIKFLNSTFGFCVNIDWDPGKAYNRILTTQSSGNNWTSHQLYSTTYDTSAKLLNAVDFISTTIGYTVGDSGKVYKTVDGGNNWTSQNSNTTNNLKSVKVTDLSKAVTVGNSGVIKATSNGGTSWYNQNSTTANNLNSLYMVNSTTGFIAGDVGTILKTTNGGVWVRKIEEIIPSNYELQQNYPNPFNPTTTIRFSIPKDNFVKINVYDINGKLVTKLLESQLTVGTYETTFDASNYNSGIYFVRLETNNTTITKKMSLIK